MARLEDIADGPAHCLRRARVVLQRVAGKRPFLFSVLFTAVFCLLFWATAVPRFDTNDDAVMMVLVSGLCGIGLNEPSALQSFATTSPLLGRLLQSAYSAFGSGVNWYAVYLYSVHVVSLVLLTYVLSSRIRRLPAFLLYVATLLYLELYFLQSIQFSTTAAMAALSSGFALVAHLEERSRIRWPAVVLSVFLLLAAGLMRKEVFLLFGLLFAPLGIRLFWRKPNIMKLVPFAAVGLLFVASRIHHRLELDESGRAFYRHSFAFARTRDNPNVSRPHVSDFGRVSVRLTPQSLQAYRENGWSNNDVQLFSVPWFFADPAVFSDDKIESICSHYRFFIRYNPLPQIMLWLTGFGLYTLVFLSAILVFAPLVSTEGRGHFFSAVGVVLLVILVLGYSWRMPYRVFLPMVLFVCVSGVYFMRDISWREWRTHARDWGRARCMAAVFTGLLLAFAVPLHRYVRANADHREGYANCEKLFARMVSVARERDAMLVCGLFPPFEYLFRPSVSELFRDVDVLLNGWVTRSPANQLLLGRRGIGNAVEALYERDDLLFMSTPAVARMVAVFIKEHYGKQVVFRPIEDLSKAVSTYGMAIYEVQLVR